MKHRQWTVPALAWAALLITAAQAARPPALELVDAYPGHVNLSACCVSEKFDGVHGYWDGRQLWTRGGNRVAVPDWFTTNRPVTLQRPWIAGTGADWRRWLNRRGRWVTTDR